MSLLLDAMKQSHNQSDASESDSFEHQQALQFYRRLSVALLAALVVIVVLSVGYFAGKWWQQRAQDTQPVVAQTVDEKAQPVVSQDTEQAQVPNQVQEATEIAAQGAPQPTAQVQGQVNLSALQMPAQYTQPYQQMVPVYVMPQMPQGYGQGAYMQWVPAYPNQMMANPHQMQMYPQAQIQTQASINNQPIDLSKYKVVGKPMDDTSAQVNGSNTSGQLNYDDAELNGVSDDLKRAFASAVAATESMDSSDSVTSTTRASAMVEPIELLPDAIQRRIPSLVYQAHIYATDQDKRWIKLNGYELYEGDSVGRLQVVEITPEQTILSIDNYEFSLEAMQDWP
ncbi:general secretion pathway protein GspB [Pseudoalteromonas sp. SSDWG2]|uniref:general secretion pathway protein GspB n=1 Tax=Pseudoalteromonas sp. SSDWG2 TaxID=3139391 RepID=UPI003BAC9BBF